MSAVILVTGGSGLVGQGIQAVLQAERRDGEKWVFLGSKDGDLGDFEATKAIFEKHRPNKVIHLAAKVGGLFKNMRCNAEMLRDNLRINDHVLQCCLLYGVEKVISCLSTCIFPDGVQYPFSEADIHSGPPHSSNYGYAHAKRILDIQSRAMFDQYGCKYFCVIPTNVYGPHDNYDLEDSHVIPGLIHKCYLAKKNGGPLVVAGTGKPVRQFIFSHDLAKLIILCLREYSDREPVILSVDPEDEVSIAHVANAICTSMGHTVPLQFDAAKADGQFKKTASNAKLRSLWPGFAFTPMDRAIEISVKWFLENYEACRK